MGFRTTPEGNVTLDPIAVFCKLPGWSSVAPEMAKTCLDSIPTLTALASKQGFLEEKHFADAGFWQTEEEKEAEEKNPRDDLALYRQRAILLTSAGFRARTEARRKELETNRRAKEDKKKDEKEQAERKKCLKRAWKELKCDQDTGCPVLPKEKWELKGKCFHCLEWFGASQEAGMRDEEYNWLQCDGCESWLCPWCVG